jgi:hypothetical protein
MNKEPIATNKILISFPFWKGDRAQAMKLARLVADLQPVHSEMADVLFVSRFDCPHDLATIEYVSRKFNVFKHTSQRQEVGWPLGCNGTFFGTMEWFYHKMAAYQIPAYKAMFIAESDGVPMVDDWISRLVLEWKKANELKKVFVAGALLPDPTPTGKHTHINGGCCFLSGDLTFLKWVTMNVGSGNVAAGWDWFLAREFEKVGWADIPGIKSEWHRPSFSESEWVQYVKRGTVWLHGIKDDSLLDLARKKLI